MEKKLEKRSIEAIKDLHSGRFSEEEIAEARGYGSGTRPPIKSFREQISRWERRGIIEQVPGGFWQVTLEWRPFINNEDKRQDGAIPEIHAWVFENQYEIPDKVKTDRLSYLRSVAEETGRNFRANPGFEDSYVMTMFKGVNVKLSSKGKFQIMLKPLEDESHEKIMARGKAMAARLAPEIARELMITLQREGGNIILTVKHEHYAFNFSPWAKFAKSLGIRLKTKIPGKSAEFWTDNSPDKDGRPKQHGESDDKDVVNLAHEVIKDAGKGITAGRNRDRIDAEASRMDRVERSLEATARMINNMIMFVATREGISREELEQGRKKGISSKIKEKTLRPDYIG